MKRRNFDWLLVIVLLLLAQGVMNRRNAAREKEAQQIEATTETTDEQGVSLPEVAEKTAGEAPETVTEETSGDRERADDAEEADVTDADGLEIPRCRPSEVLRRAGYATAYEKEWRCPRWTAWQLTASHTSGPYKRSGISFREDADVPYPKAQNSDYYNSGYDRGHMCPSGDNKWSRQAQEDCFLFTNMCPQNHNLNGGDWNDLEMKCRTWAKRYGAVYIVCGPYFRGKPSRTIGRNKVAVPDGFWKVVLRTGSEPAAIGFYYDNRGGHASMSSYVRTVDEIEQLTGLDFFPQLDDALESQVESHADLREW